MTEKAENRALFIPNFQMDLGAKEVFVGARSSGKGPLSPRIVCVYVCGEDVASVMGMRFIPLTFARSGKLWSPLHTTPFT